MNEQPLSGVMVLDFTTLLPGPLAGLMLAEAGAEVVKVEPPEGDAMRRMGPDWDGDSSAPFALLNAGKKSVAADLKDDTRRGAVRALAARADIVLEQFRPGVMARLGLGYQDLKAVNPGLIYCSITGYGQDGPLAGRAGHDLNYMGDAGLLALNPGPPEAPAVPPVLAADIAGGSYPALANILLALIRRGKTGEGAHLDISMTENLFPFAFWALAEGWSGGAWPGPGGHLFSGGSPRYRLYPASDGALVAVAAIEDRFWAAFCKVIGLDEAMAADGAEAPDVIAAVARIIAARPGAHWERAFAGADCCCSVVKSLAEAAAHPHFRARGTFGYGMEGQAGARLPALPLPVSAGFRRGAGETRRAPRLGADTAAYLDAGGAEDEA